MSGIKDVQRIEYRSMICSMTYVPARGIVECGMNC